MTSKFRFAILLLCALLFCSGLESASAALKTVSEGTYVDSHGDKQPWHVEDAHALVWGGQPYLPAGGLFEPRYLAEGQTDANWAADVADLKTLAAHGVTQLILLPAGPGGGLMKVPPDALQRVLDYLDANGFTYGLDVGDFPRDPLSAHTVNPAIYRAPAPQAGGICTFRNISGITGGSYFLVSARDGTVMTSGDVTLTDSHTATIALPQGMGGDGTVLLLYPKRTLDDTTIEGRHLPDIWSGGDTYRDQLLLYFGHIHFGKGLRFFVDPIVDDIGFFGDAQAGMVPDSDAFRLAFQIWLLTHYNHNIGLLNSKWAAKDEDLPDFETAARCVPLWYAGKGIGDLLDPTTGKVYAIDPIQSTVWKDIEQFRLESIQQEMCGLADALKSGVADVPVIYRCTQPGKLFINPNASDGFDGLLIDTEDHGDDIARNAAGFAFAEVEQASRTQWLVAELTPRVVPEPDSQPSVQPASSAASQNGYSSRPVYSQDQNSLQDIGVKGFYVNALRRLPESDWSADNLLDAPTGQLDWLKDSAADMSVAGLSFALQKPNILFYPSDIALEGAGIRELSSGVWWLPTFAAGDLLDLGPGLEGYSLDQPGGKIFVVWSPDGRVKKADFELPKGTKPFVTTPAGMVITVLVKKNTYTMPISEDPCVIAGVETLPLPSTAIDAAFNEANRLVSLGESGHTPMDIFTERIYYIRTEVLGKTAASQKLAYGMLRDTIAQLSYYLSPYMWVEGEDASSQNFGSVVSSSEASGGAYLWLDTRNPPPADDTGAYHADYTINVNSPGQYTIWAALAPGVPGVRDTSPATFSIDGGTAFRIDEPLTQGNPYGTLAGAGSATTTGGFLWCQIGSQQLTTGPHTLSFTVTGKAPDTGRYTLGIDCLCITRGNFVANGTRQPTIE